MKPKNPFISFDRYCLRTPSLSMDFLENLWRLDDVQDGLKTTLKDNFIREAIYLASPALIKQVELWEQDKIKSPKKKKRVELSLLKYLTRMSSRCTPFGLFAGCSVGIVSHETKIQFYETKNSQRIVRFDMHFLVNLAKNISNREHIKPQLLYYPNSTLYRMGNRYRYVEYTYEDKKRVHSIESVLHSKYLETILSKGRNGCRSAELVSYLESEGFDSVDSQHFLNELIANQILISELEPSITGKDFLQLLFDKVSQLDNADAEQGLLTKLIGLQRILGTSEMKDLSTYVETNHFVSSLKIDFEPQFLLQTDTYPMFKHNRLHQRTIRKVRLGIWLLNKINQESKHLFLEKFKTDFNQRFEHRKMPLLQVLDTESGIGYGNHLVEATPFLDDIQLPIQRSDENPEFTDFKKLLLHKIQNCVKNGEKRIILQRDELSPFEENWDEAADSLSVLTEIVRIDGREKVLMNYAGPHAARLLGRFATEDNDIRTLLDNITSREKELNQKSVLAEIIHIPESRTGNILRRPYLREFEIPCLGHSILPSSNQIRLDDLLVSVENDSIRLTQKNTGEDVLARLSNAHNFSNNPLPVYQFLCDLQYQNQRSYAFEWGSFFSEMEFLPRIEYGDVILSKARWLIQGKHLYEFKKIVANHNDSIKEKVNPWRKAHGINKRVELVEGDNTLLIDFGCTWSCVMLSESIKTKERFVLQEIFEEPIEITNEEGELFKNEFIFSFYNDFKIRSN